MQLQFRCIEIEKAENGSSVKFTLKIENPNASLGQDSGGAFQVVVTDSSHFDDFDLNRVYEGTFVPPGAIPVASASASTPQETVTTKTSKTK